MKFQNKPDRYSCPEGIWVMAEIFSEGEELSGTISMIDSNFEKELLKLNNDVTCIEWKEALAKEISTPDPNKFYKIQSWFMIINIAHLILHASVFFFLFSLSNTRSLTCPGTHKIISIAITVVISWALFHQNEVAKALRPIVDLTSTLL